MQRVTRARVGSAVAALLAAASALAQPGDRCDGTFTVAGAAAHLRFAYAAIDPLFSKEDKEYVRVVLSDVSIPREAVTDDFALQKAMRDRKMHAVVLIISPERQVASAQLYDAGFDLDSVSSAGTNNRFEATVLDKSRVAGKAYTKDPRDFHNVRYEYSATFDAAIRR